VRPLVGALSMPNRKLPAPELLKLVTW
jgi:hypothetical protein